MKTLHNTRFEKQPLMPTPVDEIRGYQACMSDIVDYLKEVTGFKPENRMIDSVPILDMIQASAKEFGEILQKEQEELNELTKNF